MLEDLVEKMDRQHAWIGCFSKEMETIRKNQMTMVTI